MENPPPPRGGEVSADVIWGKKYEKAKRRRGKYKRKRKKRERNRKKGERKRKWKEKETRGSTRLK